MDTPARVIAAMTIVCESPSAMEKPAPTVAPMSAMGTRGLRSARYAMGTVQPSAAAPPMATMRRMPALVRWKASRTLGVSTLKALWVA